jgi:hypothetical protein
MELDEAGATAGAVLFTGAVQLSPQERYEWQATTPADALLAEDEPADSATADTLAAVGHPLRLRLLRGVLGGIHTVADLAELPEVGTTGQIYHHLRQLAGAGWLHTTGRGKYGVPAARVVPLLVVLSAARRRLPVRGQRRPRRPGRHVRRRHHRDALAPRPVPVAALTAAGRGRCHYAAGPS